MSVFQQDGAGIRLFIRATPKAEKNACGGAWRGPDGRERLKVRVTAAPEDGRANKTVVELIALHLGLPKSAVSISAGARDRLKTLTIAVGSEDDARGLQALITNLATGDES